MRWLASRYLRVLLATLGLTFIAYSLLRDELPMSLLERLSLGRLAVALGTLAIAVIGSALAWSTIVERPFAASGRVVLEALPAKYVPGGFGLPLSQLNFETRQGDDVGRTLARLVQHFFISVGAGGAVFLVLSVGDPSGAWEIPLAVILTSSTSLAHPSVVRRLSGHRWFTRVSFAPIGRAARAFGITFLALLAMGFGYQAVLNGLTGTGSDSIAAYVLAWTVGFAVVPVPAGLGLRESVLIANLAPMAPSTVVLASVIFRLLGIGAELLVSGIAHLAPRNPLDIASPKPFMGDDSR